METARDHYESRKGAPVARGADRHRGLAHVIEAQGITVVTDMDDTIKETNVLNREQAKANTNDTALIAQTAARVDAVLAEGLEHHLFLGRVLDKVRS